LNDTLVFIESQHGYQGTKNETVFDEILPLFESKKSFHLKAKIAFKVFAFSCASSSEQNGRECGVSVVTTNWAEDPGVLRLQCNLRHNDRARPWLRGRADLCIPTAG
jgi:hypothetical protein